MNEYEDYTTSAIFTLALLDLVPLQADVKRSELYDWKHNSGRGVAIDPKINMLVYSKEVKEVESDLKDNIMVIHWYFDLNDKYSETKLKEFLINIPYGCEIIMTNISASTQQFSMYA